MLYTDWRTSMLTMLVINDTQGQTNFDAIAPRMVEYAELRIYRELDLVTASASGVTALTPNARAVTIPASIIIVESANVITPVGQTAEACKRNPLRRVSREFLDATCPQAAVAPVPSVPRYFTVFSDTQVLVGPSPDAAYNFEAIGPIRPPFFGPGTGPTPPISDFISINLPDLLLSASMVFGAGYQKNFGAQADDPKMALSWEATYQTLKKSAEVEEARKKAQSADWQAFQPTPYATPPRGA